MATLAILCVLVVATLSPFILAAPPCIGKNCPKAKSSATESKWDVAIGLKNIPLERHGDQVGKIFEGDILMDEKLKEDIHIMNTSIGLNLGKYDTLIGGQWTGGIIPYIFAGLSSSGQAVVQQAIQDFNKYTCVRWVPRTNQNSYVRFIQSSGCYSLIGMRGGAQDVSLGMGCHYKHTAIHEMMHAMGFFHEQSRIDRDQYITVYTNNIISGMQYNFAKYRPGEADTLGIPYDIQSVMHYDSTAFSANGQRTIVSRRNPSENLGNRVGMSELDIKQINLYYNCNKVQTPKPTPVTASPRTDAPVVPKKPRRLCLDHSKLCGKYSSSGYCDDDWVEINCPVSCKICNR